jgi:predicted secreted protein
MATKARAGVGATFEVDSGGGFVYVADLVSIGGPELAVEQVEATSLDSTGGYKEYIPGALDGGTVSLTLNFTNDTAQRTLRAMLGSIDVADFRIILPTSPLARYTFAGSLTSWSQATEANAPMTAELGFKTSGAVTFAEGPPASTLWTGNANRQGTQSLNETTSPVLQGAFATAGDLIGISTFGLRQYAGFGFQPTVAQGTALTSAILTLPPIGDPGVVYSPVDPNDYTLSWEIFGWDADAPAQWGNAGNGMHTVYQAGLATTARTGPFAPAYAASQDINVTAVVQEIINRAGWVSGNRVNLAIRPLNAYDKAYAVLTSVSTMAILTLT